MALMTEAFSNAFTNLAEGMTKAVTTGLGTTEVDSQKTSRKIKELKTTFPKQVIKEMISMKKDINSQLAVKKQDLRKVIVDPAFDRGITIAERYSFGLPAVTNDLDEVSLLGYIALLKTNDPQCTKMFQELMEWMKDIPQPPGNDSAQKQ